MGTAAITNRAVALGKTFEAAVTQTTDGGAFRDPTLAAAKTGTLTTRTDNDTGTLTMTAGHGITTGARLDVYWDDPATGDSKCRYGMTVGTVATNSVPVDGGAGDNLPAAATEITAMVPQLEDFAVVSANLKSLLVGCNSTAAGATAVLVDGSLASVGAARVTPDADYIWYTESGVTNPLSADSAQVYLSHGDSTASRQVNAVALAD